MAQRTYSKRQNGRKVQTSVLVRVVLLAKRKRHSAHLAHLPFASRLPTCIRSWNWGGTGTGLESKKRWASSQSYQNKLGSHHLWDADNNIALGNRMCLNPSLPVTILILQSMFAPVYIYSMYIYITLAEPAVSCAILSDSFSNSSQRIGSALCVVHLCHCHLFPAAWQSLLTQFQPCCCF